VYLKDARFDLTRVFGGAALGLLVLLSGLLVPRLLWAWAWIWIAVGDGPHMFATYLRTLFDASMWRARPRLLGRSFWAYAPGFLAIAVGAALGSRVPFVAYVAIAALAGVVHVMRQHAGFLALYTPSGVDAAGRTRDRFVLMVALVVPYLWFLAAHPRFGNLVPASQTGLWLGLAALLTAACGVVFAAGRRGPLANAYFFVVVGVSALAYFVVARAEPLLPHATGFDQELLVVSILVSFMHQVQYVAIVGLFARARVARGVDTGLAGAIVTRRRRVFAAYGAFVLVYLAIAYGCGIYPGAEALRAARLGPFWVTELALAVFWGIALQHYVLDTFIWRFRDDEALRADLAALRGSALRGLTLREPGTSTRKDHARPRRPSP
jgi:hypothetical protein